MDSVRKGVEIEMSEEVNLESRLIPGQETCSTCKYLETLRDVVSRHVIGFGCKKDIWLFMSDHDIWELGCSLHTPGARDATDGYAVIWTKRGWEE